MNLFLYQITFVCRTIGRYLRSKESPSKYGKAFDTVKETSLDDLKELVDTIAYGQVADFDEYHKAHYGDNTLAMFAKYFMSRKRLSIPNGTTKTLLLPKQSQRKKDQEQGYLLFISGCRSSTEFYRVVVQYFDRPIIFYSLDDDVMSEDPLAVGRALRKSMTTIMGDPDLAKVTHVIGNSIGTMLASRLTIDLLQENRKRILQLALIQTGIGYAKAMSNCQALFAREIKKKLEKKQQDFSIFNKYTDRYDPLSLVPELSDLVKEGRLGLNITQGMDDHFIQDAHENVDPLIHAFDNQIKNRYSFYTSERTGHHASLLLFLWMVRSGVTDWKDVFCFPKRQSSGEVIAKKNYKALDYIKRCVRH